MTFDLDRRTVALGVGEFSAFALGPRESPGSGNAGLWRAQLGTHWHNELRTRATTEHAGAAEFEIAIAGQVVEQGWTFSLTGRIDQLIRRGDAVTLREIKTVTRDLPADESELRTDYPEYFIQLGTYAALARLGALQTQPSAPAASPELTLTDSATTLVKAATADPGTAAPASLPSPAAVPPTSLPVAPPTPVPARPARAELVFVEVSSGLVQTIPLTPADETLFRTQLARLVEFLNLRLRARERLRGLRYRPAFATPRPGQETTQQELTALFERQPLVFFEAPTGFGKTGVLLEFALGQLRSGHFDRVLYLTSKSTGQLQVVRTLAAMTAGASTSREPASPSDLGGHLDLTGRLERASPPSQQAPAPAAPSSPSNRADTTARAGAALAVWHVRNKAEHCVNATFHCVRDNCGYLVETERRWREGGLARFYLDEHHARDLDALRTAGRDARVCPYEITRTAVAFNDVWIGDYNYVFAPRNRGLFFEQPGFLAARTLLLVDEAHNLPARVADAYSHGFTATAAYAVRDDLHRVRPPAPLLQAWEHWCHFLQHLHATNELAPADEDDARHLLGEIAKHVRAAPLDLAALGPAATDALWSVPSLLDDLAESTLPRLWWSPRDGELALTCLDAAPAIAASLREFGGVVLASATLSPTDGMAAACGLDAPPDVPPPPRERPPPEKLGRLTKRDTRKLFQQVTRGSDLLRVEEARDAARPALLRAHTPWRDGSYDVAIDTRVDTTFQHRSQHFTTTAATIVALHLQARTALADAPPLLQGPTSCVAVFFPSYAYAEAIRRELSTVAPDLRVRLQPKIRDLAAQTAWVDDALLAADAVFLVLGSSFAESIDVLGGRVTHAIVVGPALPEVNAVQRARLAEANRRGLSRDEAFRHVYQIPGMTKVNQALGRLVRAPGHRARVLLHCRRFAEPAYHGLLATEYQAGTVIADDSHFAAWLKGTNLPAAVTEDSAP